MRAEVALLACTVGCSFPDYVAESDAAIDTNVDDVATDVGVDASDAADTTKADSFDASKPTCNATPATGFGAPARMTNLKGVTGADTNDSPFVFPDGLTLYFTGLDTLGRKHLHVVKRPDRASDFGTGALVDITDVGGVLRSRDVADTVGHGVDEIFFGGTGNDLWTAKRSGGAGPFAAVRMGLPVDTSDNEVTPTITEDGLRLIFGRIAPTTLSYHLYEATRPSVSATSWTDASQITGLTGLTQTCPTISTDGLTLYYAVATSTTASEVYFTQRTSLSGAFGTPTKIPILSPTGALDCPRSITADGCELYMSIGGAAHVAKRSPTP